MTWGELYALVCLETGWTWEYVDEEMTMIRLDGFMGIWKQSPPIRTLLSLIGQAVGLTFKGADDAAPPAPKKDIGSYIEAFSGAGITVERVPKHG